MDSWKNLLSFINVIRCLVNVYCASLSEEWSYSDISAWSNIPKSRCGGTRQSPIDIIDAEAVSLKRALGLHFTNYNVSVDVSLENNGRTAKLGPLSFHNLTVAGAGLYLKNKFTLEEIHFHWGGTANTGSEHKFNGQSSSMEVHLVHYNLEKYSNIEMAKEKSDGVLVLSVLTEGSKNAAFNNIFKEIASELATIVNPGSKGNLANLKLQNLLPNNVRDYYIYKGSFTTPPCSETVTWIVFKEKLLILKEYLEEFRALFTIFNKTHKVRLSSNIRPVQPLNSRTVLKTFDTAVHNKYYSARLKKIAGMEVVSILTFYPCHLPPSLSLSVLIPSLDISWKSINLTADMKNFQPLERTLSYGVRIEMHDHPLGHYKDNVHVTVRLKKSPEYKPVEIVNNYFKLDKNCFHDLCHWLTPQISRRCERQLIDSDQTLSFTLSLQDPCSDSYKLVVEKQDSVIFNATFRSNTKKQFKPMGVDQLLNDSLRIWHLVLYVNKTSGDDVKLFLSIPGSMLSRKTLVMDVSYGNKSKCKRSGGVQHHVKLIVGVAVCVFVFTMVLLTIGMLYRRYKDKPRQNYLVDKMEEDMADSDSL